MGSQSIILHDCTLRDGNHAVSHSLSDEQVAAYARLADQAGLDVVEVGHGNGLGASSLQVGLARHTDEHLMRVARSSLRYAQLAVHVIPGYAKLSDIDGAADAGVDVVRVGTHCSEADTSCRYLSHARARGLAATGVLMMSHMVDASLLRDQARIMVSAGAQAVVFMDSAGTYLDEEVRHRTRELRELAQLAKTSPLSINELRVILALERIVARVEAHSVLRETLIFKGGSVLLKSILSDRFTRDIDALAYNAPKQQIVEMVVDALKRDLDDGLYYGEPEVEDLIDQGQYGGYRMKVPFQIGELPAAPRQLRKLSRVHIDIGFGDVVFGRPKRIELSPLLPGAGEVSWTVYPLESVYAEKLETLVSREDGNSRAKDLYDLVVLFPQIEESTSLVQAIRKTFANRGTTVPPSFADLLRQLHLTVMERAWGSVELAGGTMTFEECRNQATQLFARLDDHFRGNRLTSDALDGEAFNV